MFVSDATFPASDPESRRTLERSPPIGEWRDPRHSPFFLPLGCVLNWLERWAKIHALTDEHGRPSALVVTAGNTHDLVGAAELLRRSPTPRQLLAASQ